MRSFSFATGLQCGECHVMGENGSFQGAEFDLDEGIYDFGVWEMNELARHLEADGMVAEAATILELNEEFHPRSATIPRRLGPLYEMNSPHQPAHSARLVHTRKEETCGSFAQSQW